MVVETQLGESLSTQVAVLVSALVSCAAKPPECPPATRVSVMLGLPDPPVSHPAVSVSKPGLPTKLAGGGTDVLVVEEGLVVEVLVVVEGGTVVVLVDVVAPGAVVLVVLVVEVVVVGGAVVVVVADVPTVT